MPGATQEPHPSDLHSVDEPGAAAAKMAVPCAWARGMNLYGIAAIPWFPSEGAETCDV